MHRFQFSQILSIDEATRSVQDWPLTVITEQPMTPLFNEVFVIIDRREVQKHGSSANHETRAFCLARNSGHCLTLLYFKFIVQLWRVTACYVTDGFYMSKVMGSQGYITIGNKPGYYHQFEARH